MFPEGMDRVKDALSGEAGAAIALRTRSPSVPEDEGAGRRPVIGCRLIPALSLKTRGSRVIAMLEDICATAHSVTLQVDARGIALPDAARATRIRKEPEAEAEDYWLRTAAEQAAGADGAPSLAALGAAPRSTPARRCAGRSL